MIRDTRRSARPWRPGSVGDGACPERTAPFVFHRRGAHEQDRGAEGAQGRARRGRGHSALREARPRVDRGRRSRPAEVVGRVHPQADPGSLHDAAAHPERGHHRRSAPRHRRPRQPHGPGAGRHHHAPAGAAPVDPHPGRPGDPGSPARRRAGHAADRHGQHPQHHRLPRVRPHAERGAGRLPGGPGLHRDVRGEQGLHEPAAEVQRRHHRLPRELHPLRDPGHRAGAGGEDLRPRRGEGLQRARRRQERLRRLPGGLVARRVRAAGGGGRDLQRDRAGVPRPRLPRRAQQDPPGLPDRRVGRGAVPRGGGGAGGAAAREGGRGPASRPVHRPRRGLPPEAARAELRGAARSGGARHRRSAPRAGPPVRAVRDRRERV